MKLLKDVEKQLNNVNEEGIKKTVVIFLDASNCGHFKISHSSAQI